jgi:alkyl sulfatase BDS1-like metallo-beta-lactamase superfamily hydrolase
VKAGLIKIDGDPRKVEDFVSMLDTFQVMFEVVEPKPSR